ncbi:MAG: hypothetical protein LBB38_02785 [Puniceicoccales bacterium]|nr:hypothetical protein [Puniceicoccales bacterium]
MKAGGAQQSSILDVTAMLFSKATQKDLDKACKASKIFDDAWGGCCSWKMLSIATKSAIILLTIITVGIFLLVAYIYMVMRSGNPRTNIGLLHAFTNPERTHGRTVEQINEHVTEARAYMGQRPYSQPMTMPTAQQSNYDDTILGYYAKYYPPNGSYIGKFILNHPTMKLTGESRHYDFEDCLCLAIAKEGNVYVTVDREKVVASMHYALEYKTTDARLGFYAFLLEQKEGTPISEIFSVGCVTGILDPSSQLKTAAVAMEFLFFYGLAKELTDSYPDHANKFFSLRETDPGELIRLCNSKYPDPVKFADHTRTTYGEVYAEKFRSPCDAAYVVIYRMDYEERFSNSKVFSAMAFLSNLTAEWSVGLTGKVRQQLNEKSQLPKYLTYCIGESSCVELTRDRFIKIIQPSIYSANRNDADIRAAIEITLDAANTEWPGCLLSRYAGIAAEDSYIGKFISANANFLIPHIGHGNGRMQDLRRCLDGGGNIIAGEAIFAVASLLEEYNANKSEEVELRLIAAIYLFNHGCCCIYSLTRYICSKIKPKQASDEKERDDILETLTLLFGYDNTIPKRAEDVRSLRRTDPEAYVDGVRSMTPHAIPVAPNPYSSAVCALACATINRELCDKSRVFSTLLALSGETVGADYDMSIVQCLEADLPKFIKVDGTWTEATPEAISAMLIDYSKPASKNDRIAALDAAKRRWPEFDFSACNTCLA